MLFRELITLLLAAAAFAGALADPVQSQAKILVSQESDGLQDIVRQIGHDNALLLTKYQGNMG